MKKRGFILTLDAIVATTIVMALLVFVSTQMNREDKSPWTESQMLTTGYDTMAMLRNTGILQTLNQSLINQTLIQTLPQQYVMMIQIKPYQNVGGTWVSEPPIYAGYTVNGSIIVHGTRTFITFSDGQAVTFGDAEFWVGLQ